uniref:Uncharacterized protein n=1 Tax=Schistocephalus solidus TaxID=70667 RepID=A0A0X3PEI1_SCHSO
MTVTAQQSHSRHHKQVVSSTNKSDRNGLGTGNTQRTPEDEKSSRVSRDCSTRLNFREYRNHTRNTVFKITFLLLHHHHHPITIQAGRVTLRFTKHAETTPHTHTHTDVSTTNPSGQAAYVTSPRYRANPSPVTYQSHTT